jgi:hypothetical protein
MLDMPGDEELKPQGEQLDGRDFVPPNDAAEPIPETRQRQDDVAPKADEPAKEIKQGSPFDKNRQSIVEKLRAERDKNDKNPSIDIPADMERKQVGPHIATREDRNRPPAAVAIEELKPENIPEPRRVTLKVNGEERVLDEQQALDYAQVALASEDILNKAKREREAALEERRLASEELAELRRLRADHSSKPEAQSNPTPVKAEDTKPATDEELDSLIDAIQTGEIPDARKAFQQYGDQIERRMLEKLGNIDQRIATTIRQREEDTRVQRETQQVISAFLSENDDFESHPLRAKALIDETVEVMRDNLKAIGVQEETITNISRKYNVAPQVAVGMATRMLRGNGYELDDSAAVMRTAAKRVREGFGLTAPAARQQPAQVTDPTPSIVADRIERKQAMSPQPRRANISPGADPAPEKSQEQRRIDAVRQMKAMRRGR